MHHKNSISSEILRLAALRGIEKTICPSEVARSLFADNWRGKMDDIRSAAFDLAQQNKVLIMQKGQQISPGDIKGPIRIRIIDTENALANRK